MAIISSRCDHEDYLKDALAFASDWAIPLADQPDLFAKAILQRAFQAAEASKQELLHPDPSLRICCVSETQQALLERNLKTILDMIPKNYLRITVHDAVTYLVEEIHELSETINNNSSQKNNNNNEELNEEEDLLLEMKIEVSLLTTAAVTLTSHFLDSLRDASHPNPKESSDLITANNNSKSQKQAETQNSSFLTHDFYSALKRMNLLQVNFNIFLSLSDIQDTQVCRLTCRSLAQKRVDDILSSCPNLSPVTGIPTGEDGMPVMPLSPSSRKACLLLQVSSVFFSHTAMKHLVQLGFTVRQTDRHYRFISSEFYTIFHF